MIIDGINITKRLKDALLILKDTSYSKPLTARQFGERFWPNSKIHRVVLNTGNGACAGKAAWLSAGSYLRKLEKRKIIRVYFSDTLQPKYYILEKGINILKQLN